MSDLPPVIVNEQAGRLLASRSSGTDEVAEWLEQMAEDTRLLRVAAEDYSSTVEDLLAGGHRRIAVGGGDGTLRTAAGIIERNGADVELVLLPLGTHNHFAKDLGVPLDPARWRELATSPTTAGVDLGEVNGHLFLNNVSIGLYPAIVQQRQTLPRERILGSKRLATLWSGYRIWRSLPSTFGVSWQSHGANPGARRLRTRLLLVSNNQYADEPLAPLRRDELQGGRLTLFAARSLRLGSAVNMA